jgi:transcription antitermination factor NusG
MEVLAMFAVGDDVKIIDGSFCDFEGRIKEVHPTVGKVCVTISIFGHPETIELDFAQIERATAN